MDFRFAAVTSLALLVSVPALASTINGDYSYTIVQQTRALGQNESYVDSMILNDGSVATVVRAGQLSGGSATGQDRIEIVSPNGLRRVVTIAPNVRLDINGDTLSANSKGQIAVSAFVNSNLGASSTRRELWLIEPDDTIRVLVSAPAIQPTGVADPSLSSFTNVRINEAGEVAASGSYRTENGQAEVRVVKVAATSAVLPSITVLDQSDPSGSIDRRDVQTPISIDDAGKVAWTRQQGGVNFLMVSDGLNETVAIESSAPGRQLYISSELTNNGMLGLRRSGQGIDLGTSDITDSAVVDDYDLAYSPSSTPTGWDLNEFGQWVYREGINQGSIYVDGERVIGTSDSIGEFELDRNSNGALRTNNGQFLNDSGQFVFDARGFTNEGGYRLTVRADPIGATVENPILPEGTSNGVTDVSYGIVNALGLQGGNPIFVDPVFGTGLEYEITNGGPNFMSLLIPFQDLGGLDMFDVSFAGLMRSVGFGETLDFAALVSGGVSKFTIFGKDGATSFTGDFVAGFTHASLGNVEISITSASTDMTPIPLPASMWLMLGGFGLLGFLRRRKLT